MKEKSLRGKAGWESSPYHPSLPMRGQESSGRRGDGVSRGAPRVTPRRLQGGSRARGPPNSLLRAACRVSPVSSLASRFTALQSHFWRPSPVTRQARGLSHLSGSPPPLAQWLLGRHLASVSLTIPPVTTPARAGDPPFWVAHMVTCAGWFQVEVGAALFVFVVVFFFPISLLSFIIFAFG